MKNQALAFLLCIVLGNFSISQAEVIETAHFRDLVSHVTLETLIILDLDDTLLIPTQMLGCDDWFLWKLKKNKAEGMSSSLALEKSLAEWEAIRHLSKMKIVEEGTDRIIQDLQAKGFCIMGLTTQGLALATRSVLQLKEHNMDLSLTAPSKEDKYFLLNDHGVLYRKGILFTSGMPKGEALFQLCETIGYQPKRIVFINDKRTHIAEIEIPAEKRGVEFLGLRYAYADKHKAIFSSEIADFQFKHSTFDHLLTDEEALKMMANTP